MSNTPNQNNRINSGPVATHRDGAVFSKVWRNWSKEGDPYYSVTFGRTYTDAKTGQIKESQTFQGTDVLKIEHLAPQAYQSIARFREADRTAEQTQSQGHIQQNSQAQQPVQQSPQEPPPNMAAQRDQVMNQAQPAQEQAPVQHMGPQNAREL